MIVIISGFAGSGKSTLAKGLVKKLGLKVIYASGILKELADKKIGEIVPEKAVQSKGFWESSKGKELVKKRLADPSMDRALDEKLLEIIEHDNAVIDSKTMGYLSKKGIKIWIRASLETRAKRIAGRDKLPEKEVRKTISARDNADKKIYKQLYGFELGKNLEKFNIIIDNEKLSAEQTLKKALDYLNSIKAA